MLRKTWNCMESLRINASATSFRQWLVFVFLKTFIFCWFCITQGSFGCEFQRQKNVLPSSCFWELRELSWEVERSYFNTRLLGSWNDSWFGRLCRAYAIKLMIEVVFTEKSKSSSFGAFFVFLNLADTT